MLQKLSDRCTYEGSLTLYSEEWEYGLKVRAVTIGILYNSMHLLYKENNSSV